MTMDADEIEKLIGQAVSGNETAVAELFEQHRPRLRRLLLLRMHPRLLSRVDASDVLQDTYLELARRLPEYGRDHDIPFYLWLRMLAGKQLTQLHRKHLNAEMRTAFREVAFEDMVGPDASVMNMASHFAGQFTSVDRKMVHEEVFDKLLMTLGEMHQRDREIVAMRHFEELSTAEIATLLGISRSGVLKRYMRTIRRLHEAMGDDQDFRSE